MTQVTTSPESGLTSYRYFVSVLLKLIGLFLLFFSLGYWARLVGISDPAVGFDTLPVYWKVAGAALVILLPIAALGIWGNSKWGIVVWFLVVAIELVMYGLYPTLFGQAQGRLLFHIITVLTYSLSIVLIVYLEQRNLHRSQI